MQRVRGTHDASRDFQCVGHPPGGDALDARRKRPRGGRSGGRRLRERAVRRRQRKGQDPDNWLAPTVQVMQPGAGDYREMVTVLRSVDQKLGQLLMLAEKHAKQHV